MWPFYIRFTKTLFIATSFSSSALLLLPAVALQTQVHFKDLWNYILKIYFWIPFKAWNHFLAENLPLINTLKLIKSRYNWMFQKKILIGNCNNTFQKSYSTTNNALKLLIKYHHMVASAKSAVLKPYSHFH